MLSNLQVENDVYFSEATKVMVRANREYLLRLTTDVNIIHKNYVQAHKYDFNRIIRQHGVPLRMQWIVQYLNGIEDPNQDVSGMTSFKNINEDIINQMLTRMNTVRT